MRLSTSLKRGVWCIVGIAVLRLGIAAFAGRLGSAGIARAMGGYTRGPEGFLPSLLSVLSDAPSAVAVVPTILAAALLLGALANLLTVGGVLAHLRAPGSIGAFVNNAIRWAPAMVTSALWVSLLRLAIIPIYLVTSSVGGTSAALLVGVALWAITIPIHDRTRAMIIEGRITRRYGPRAIKAAVVELPRRLRATSFGAMAWLGTIASAAGASAVGLALAESPASVWAIRGLGLLAVTLTVLRLSLAVDED
jgi:hypothetical protein